MSKVIRSSPLLLWVLVLVSILAGFAHWALFLAPAFLGGFLFKKTRVIKHAALQAALATSAGWILTALVRDIIEGGRLSSRLASFLGLSWAFEMYLVVFALCFLPALFAAASGSSLSVWFESRTQSRPASGR